MGEPPAKASTTAPWGLVLIPTGWPALTDPGAPVYSIRDMLEGWVVHSATWTPVVYAPTEGDGDTHPLERSVWGLKLLWDGGVVDDGWDRARRQCVVNGVTGVALRLFGPNLNEVLFLARALEAAGGGRVVLLDSVDGVLQERAP